MLFCLYEYICIYIPTLVSEHANFCLLAPNSNPIVFSPQKTKPPSWVACFLAGAIGYSFASLPRTLSIILARPDVRTIGSNATITLLPTHNEVQYAPLFVWQGQ